MRCCLLPSVLSGLVLTALVCLFAQTTAHAGGVFWGFDEYRGKWPKLITAGNGVIERTEDHAESGDYCLHIQSGNTDAAEARSHAYGLEFVTGDYYRVQTLYYAAAMPHWCLVLDNGHVHVVHDGGWFKYRTAAGVNVNICPASTDVWYYISCWVRWPLEVYNIWVVGTDGTNVTVEDAAFFLPDLRSYEDEQYYLRIGDFTDATNHCDSYWDDIEITQGIHWPVKFGDDFEDDSLTPTWNDVVMLESDDYFGLTTADFRGDEPALLVSAPGLTHCAMGCSPPIPNLDPSRKWEFSIRFELQTTCYDFRLWDNGQVCIGVNDDNDIVAYTGEGEVQIADGYWIFQDTWYDLEVTVDPAYETYDAELRRNWNEEGSATGIAFNLEAPYGDGESGYWMQLGDVFTTCSCGRVIFDDFLVCQASTRGRGVGDAGSGYMGGGAGGGAYNLVEIPWTLTTDLTDADWDSAGTELYITGGDLMADAVVYLATGEMLDPVQILPPEMQPGGRLNAFAWNPDWSEALVVGEREEGEGPARVLRFDGAHFTPEAPIPGLEVDLHDVAWRPDGSLALLVGGLADTGLSAIFGYTPAGGIYAIGALTYGPCRAVAWSPSGAEAVIVTSGPAPGMPGAVLLCDGSSVSHLGFMGSFPWAYCSVDFHPEQDVALIGGGATTGLETGLLRYEAGALEEIFVDPEAGCVRVVAWDPAGDFALGVTSCPDGRRARLVSDGDHCILFYDTELAPPLNALVWAPVGSGSGIEPIEFGSRALGLWCDPNPFDARTTLHLEIPEHGIVDLEIFDVTGRRIRTLLAGELISGRIAPEWNGTDDAGRSLPQGVYLCRLRAGRDAVTTKLLWLK